MTRGNEKAFGKATTRINFDRVALPISALLLTFLFIFNAKTTSNAVISALSDCALKIVPSVFPCMVLSGLFVSCGGSELFMGAFGRTVGKIYSVPSGAACAILLGAVCGAPVGASTAYSLFKAGSLTKDELERLIGLVVMPSPAFIINAVGASMLKSQRKGVLLYLIFIVSSAIIGIVGGRLVKARDCDLGRSRAADTHYERVGFADALVSSIASSTTATLKICAFVVFFVSISSNAESLVRLFSESDVASSLVYGFFEFSGGCAKASALNPELSLPITALILGWSGVSMHFQTASFCQGVSLKKYYLSVFLRGLLCFVLAVAVNSLPFDIY